MEESRSAESPPDVSYVLDALKWSADEELTMAERLSVKARHSFVLGVGFFTIVQTVAFNNFAAAEISAAEKVWLLALAIAAIVALCVAAGATVQAELLIPARYFPTGSPAEKAALAADLPSEAQPTASHRGSRLGDERRRRSRELRAGATKPPPQLQPALSLLGAINDLYERPDENVVPGKLASAYVTIVDERRRSNELRRRRYARTRWAVGAAIVTTTSELIFALAARI